MKYLSYEGLQYLYGKILTRLGLKVDVTGGDISETVIETLDTVEDKYPIPATGESVKRFLGKTLTFLRNIRPLTENINIYVSTTGSDILGNGTSASPFRTIQYAIDTLPKDFGGYFATITVSSGTYNEDITISGFTGTLQFILLGNVTTGSITVGNARVVCTASTVCTFSIKYLYVTASGRFDSFASVGITTTGYIENQPVYGGKASIVLNRGDVYISGPITLTGNTDVGIASIAVSRIYFSTVSGSGFNVGLFVANGSIIYVGVSNSISATNKAQPSSGGMIINANGTQISDDITAGLSCTWGTIRSGYVRHGNLNGAAMISINMRVESTSALTAGNMYTISGFPAPAISSFSTISVCTDMPGRTAECWLNLNGAISFKPNVNVAAGTWNITFSATYKTNS